MFKAIYRIRASLRFIPQTLKEKSIFPPPTSIIPSYSFAHLPARLEHKEADADEVNKDPGSHPKLFVVKPRFRPDALLKTEYDEALNLVNSLGEQRDGYHGTYFSEKESPRHNVVHSPAYRSTHADTFFGPGNGDIVKCHLNAEDSKCGVDAVFVNGILTGIPQRNFLAELSVPMYKRTRPVRICGTDGRYTFGAAGEAEIVAAGRGSSSRGFTSGAGETIPQLQRRRFPASKTHAVHQASKMHLPTEKDDRWLGLIRLDNNSRGSFNDQPYDEFAGDVEKIYRILRKFHSRVPKLELALQESGVTVRSGLTERVLNRCGDAGSLGYKFFVWASKQPGYSHSHDVYKSIIRILGKMRQFGAVWALIEEMRRENPQLITPQVFVVLMRRFASARMVKKAVKVLDEMPKYGCEPDEYVFGCLLDALCKNGSVKEAALLFEDMRVRFPPTIKHFTSLLYGWCKEGKLMEAKFVLVQMREAGFEPDIVVYNNLLNGYAVAGKMVDAFDLLQEMRRKKCHPNAASFTILIQALCGQEKMEAAMQVFLDMERSGCEADVVTYTTLISGFCKWGKTEKGYELMDRMIQRGHAPNQTTYLHILNSHEKKDELEECVELVQEIQKVGCSPDLNIYNTIIRLAFKLGEVKEGVRVWNQMEADGLSPGLDNFVNMIHGLIDQECLVEASDYFKEMVGRGLLSAPQYGLLKKLLNSLLRADKLQVSKDVWGCITNKGCELNVYAWTIWIHALFSKGHVKEACSYCLDMMDAGVMPQPDTFAKLMKGLRKLYNRQIAAEITEKVRQMAAERKITFKMYKRRGERDLKEKAKAKKDGRKTRARRRCWGRAKADTFFGPGTVDNVKCHLNAEDSKDGVDAVFVNGILTGIQQRNLERAWGKAVVDRVGLIIEIFHAHAQTKEAKLQAELAALMYKRTRLVRIRGSDGRYTFGAAGEAEVVSARGRGSGGRGFISGAGETELQLQRRRIIERRNQLLSEIKEVRRTRALQRASRKRHGGSHGQDIPTVAIVGYTNAGKSTLVSALSDTYLFCDDRMFATVDPKVRSVMLPSGKKVLLSDTVGFISELPVQLVEAFHATLEEVVEADLLVHVLDSSAPNRDEQRESVLQVLHQIGVSDEKLRNMIEVWNKIDLEEDEMAANEQSEEDVYDDDDNSDGWLSPGGGEEVRWDDASASFVGWNTPEDQPKDASNTSGVITSGLKSRSECTPCVKTSAITRVGLQELLELIDDKLKTDKVVERSVFDRKWRPQRELDTGLVVG